MIRDLIGDALGSRGRRTLKLMWIMQARAPTIDRSVQTMVAGGQPPLLPERRSRALHNRRASNGTPESVRGRIAGPIQTPCFQWVMD